MSSYSSGGFVDDDDDDNNNNNNNNNSNNNVQKPHCICSYANLFQSHYELHLLSDPIAVVKFIYKTCIVLSYRAYSYDQCFHQQMHLKIKYSS
jgi:hypothetical protein